MKKYFIHTFGCQMNARESEKLAGMLEAMGYARTADVGDAHLILYNTCCVRGGAENKILGNLSFLKHRKETEPELLVAVCGCMAQQEHVFRHIQKKLPFVDVVFGTANHHMFPALLERRLQTGKPALDISGADNPPRVSPDETSASGALQSLTTREHRHKAGVNVMYGCNNFCSYCIVPYVRGRERSRQPEDVLREAKALAADGVKEIMLLGQNVNSYEFGFAALLRRVNGIDGIERVRFMTSHPKDCSDDLIEAVRDCGKVCKAVHLPIQSGSTRVLRDMNRRYTKDDYLRLTERIRAAIPRAAISTDIIVGYPGETESDFLETLDVVRRVRFAGAFTFIYSAREGTPAAARTDEVPPEVAAERFKRLTDEINPILLERNTARVGTACAVMSEGESSNLGVRARAEDNTLVHVKGAARAPGEIMTVQITGAKTFYLLAE